MKEKLEEEIIRIGIKLARRGEGALIIIGEKIDYTPLVKQTISSFNIFENLKLLENLSCIDGAVIINPEGFLVAYGVKVKSDEIMQNFGTRHSAGLSASLVPNTTCYLISQEERKIKIFKSGQIVMQIDALEKNIEKKIPEITHLLESVGVGALGFLGATSMGMVGITLIGGVIIFGSFYYLLKKFGDKSSSQISDFFKRWDKR